VLPRVFDAYSKYYDLLYRDKDYAAEANCVADVCQRHGATGLDLLDLGCGTGRHAAELARLGYAVSGVERSPTMLARAQEQRERLDASLAERLRFHAGDACSFRAGRRFDVVTSLFHVLSYQVYNDLVKGLIATAAAHLAPGGLFVFDYWYGPAVLSQKPEARFRSIADDEVEILRFADPRSFPNENRVDVNYTIVVREKKTGVSHSLSELHSMRYFFAPELEWYLQDAGFDVVHTGDLLRPGASLGTSTWNAMHVARRRPDKKLP
jgi:SAM-dependent methyltransferase